MAVVVTHNHVRKMEGAMDTIRNRLTQDCFCDATDPDKCNPCKDAGKYDELLAYVKRLEFFVKNHSEVEPLEAWMNRPEWLHRDAVSLTPEPEMVTVCDKCLCASCWQGIFYCDDYKYAGIVQKTVAELQSLNLENPDYWKAK